VHQKLDAYVIKCLEHTTLSEDTARNLLRFTREVQEKLARAIIKYKIRPGHDYLDREFIKRYALNPEKYPDLTLKDIAKAANKEENTIHNWLYNSDQISNFVKKSSRARILSVDGTRYLLKFPHEIQDKLAQMMINFKVKGAQLQVEFIKRYSLNPEKYPTLASVAMKLQKAPRTINTWLGKAQKLSDYVVSAVGLNRLSEDIATQLLQFTREVQEKLARAIIKYKIKPA
jgi:hypothetical protein